MAVYNTSTTESCKDCMQWMINSQKKTGTCVITVTFMTCKQAPFQVTNILIAHDVTWARLKCGVPWLLWCSVSYTNLNDAKIRCMCTTCEIQSEHYYLRELYFIPWILLHPCFFLWQGDIILWGWFLFYLFIFMKVTVFAWFSRPVVCTGSSSFRFCYCQRLENSLLLRVCFTCAGLVG